MNGVEERCERGPTKQLPRRNICARRGPDASQMQDEVQMQARCKTRSRCAPDARPSASWEEHPFGGWAKERVAGSDLAPLTELIVSR